MGATEQFGNRGFRHLVVALADELSWSGGLFRKSSLITANNLR